MIPIATPIDAYFRAGASFTPSPVIATISSIARRIWTSLLLCLGSVLEKTLPPFPANTYFAFSSDIASSSYPVKDTLI